MSTKELDFTDNGIQTYYDSWRQTERTCVYVGKCAICGKRTYEFLDGENDPRGPLGDNASYSLRLCEHDNDYENSTIEIPLCFNCGNEYGSYQLALEIAREEHIENE